MNSKELVKEDGSKGLQYLAGSRRNVTEGEIR